ncbi:alpha/beta hydrolase [Nocardia cyriacigeorgica]|uniref:alpha/beta hydrolase n=1 Tax=Nocardia cyriacigeorgica TaxID=135487 RepID=UPI0018933435|nr:alpha/beta hydrolase [Nocardia cyriacigeorgica]MBF6434815.1 alpha/beta hydrolase [Nocardia cyriacigeorgica]
MDYRRYDQFLPAGYRAESLTAPESTWWSWRGHRVHVARARVPEASVRVLAVHGAGGHAGLVWPIAALAAQAGVDTMAIDMPLYGDTVVPDPHSVRYTDWIELLCEFVCAETASDPRPLIVFGASMGGMLAYEVAARTGAVAHVVATCLLDPADPAARRAAVRWSFTGGAAPTVLRSVRPLAGGLRVPIKWLVDMGNMSLDPELSRLCAADPKGGGVRVPLGFLADFLDFTHTPPESTTTPLTLAHPAADRWTPPELSLRLLHRIAAQTRLVLLDGCGHFPIEDPGIRRLRDTLIGVLEEVSHSH